MSQAPQRSALSGLALVRLLARLGEADVAESTQSLADRLSQWLGWTDAIALSSALSGGPPAVAGGARPFGRAEEDECTRVRRALVSSIAGDALFASSRRRGAVPAPRSAATSAAMNAPMNAPMNARPASARASALLDVNPQADYAVFRQRYLALQQSMETAIGTLRSRLRALLATQAPALARLAVVDAVMERALAERERSLLGAVPGLLGGHFERLRKAEQRRVAELEAVEAQAVAAAAQKQADGGAAEGGAVDDASARQAEPMDATAPAPAATAGAATSQPAVATASPSHVALSAPDAWLDVFRKDMQSVLLAELDVRFQPVEGLLAALRAC
ncbi:hypothetical protein BTH42_07520 [Burkholderia sp. SRS-W-2-2016]|uniref:DUF3348 domain-containing protein n=1 Tax=Burkholderia sp. SRS-W-2-2016 TaxID=1926878 RepID=UPI00094B12AE|nr:DUF3348 domain-containing protein [Burkholderia sp. SRS-W-2-2016]OLL32287.1 hypothetical protein BTH42_07520 [Burkholderia sp. SRS-W-2-2016]